MPVAVQLDGPKHGTPAPNQYNVCAVCLNNKLLLKTTLWDCVVHPVADAWSFCCFCIDRSVVVADRDSPRRLVHQLSSQKQDVTLCAPTKLGHRHVITPRYLNAPCKVLHYLILYIFLLHKCVEGHYEVNNSVIQQGSRAVLSPFKSKTQRIPAPVDHRVPGPGAYSSHQTPTPARRTILP